MKKITLVTDGSCLGNPGPGGWACILSYQNVEKHLTGGAVSTTNNRMELSAAIGGLATLKEPCLVEVVTDSQYVVHGMTKYLTRWEQNGWHTANRAVVQNRDLWEQLAALARSHQVTWTWVRGHATNELQNRCDVLARTAAEHQQANQ